MKRVNEIQYQVVINGNDDGQNLFDSIKEASAKAKALASELAPGSLVNIVRHFYKHSVLKTFTVEKTTQSVLSVKDAA